jgi:hypothetical protein
VKLVASLEQGVQESSAGITPRCRDRGPYVLNGHRRRPPAQAEAHDALDRPPGRGVEVERAPPCTWITPGPWDLDVPTIHNGRSLSRIEASVNLGCPPWRVVLGHILPNIFGPLVVEATLVLSAAILIEASQSFLGLGAPPPTASWGSMLATAQRRPDLAHLVIVPGVALTLTALALSLCGDALRDAVNGRGRSRA